LLALGEWRLDYSISGTEASAKDVSEVYIGLGVWSSFSWTSGYSIQSEFNPPDPYVQMWDVYLPDNTEVQGYGLAPIAMQGQINNPEPGTLGLLASGLALLLRLSRRTWKH